MVRMRRALGILPVIALLLAACARGTGAGATDTSTEPSGSSANQPSTSASAAPSASEAATTGRIDIGALVGDAASYQGQEITVLGRVDSVLADGKAFTTSPNGDDIAAAGAAIGVDQLADYQGDYVIVASDIADPLNSGS